MVKVHRQKRCPEELTSLNSEELNVGDLEHHLETTDTLPQSINWRHQQYGLLCACHGAYTCTSDVCPNPCICNGFHPCSLNYP